MVCGFFAVDKIFEVCLGISIRYELLQITLLEAGGAVVKALGKLLHALEGGTGEPPRVGVTLL